MKYSNCSSDRSIQHQSIFENSLLELMLVQKYQAITVTDVSNRAGLSRKSFYHYFDGKDGCLQALVDHTIQNIQHQQMLGTDGTFSLVNMFSYWKTQHKLIDALYQNNMINFLLSRILFFATEEDGFRTYVARNKKNITREQVIFVVGGLFAVLVDWYLSDYEKNPQVLTESLNSFLLR